MGRKKLKPEVVVLEDGTEVPLTDDGIQKAIDPGDYSDRKKKRKRKKIPIPILIAMLKRGYRIKEIADQLGVTDVTIRKHLHHHRINWQELQSYHEARADVLAHKGMQILNGITPDKIEKASIRDAATAYNVIHNAERLARGQSTSNISVAHLTKDLARLEEQETRLQEELQDMLKCIEDRNTRTGIPVEVEKFYDEEGNLKPEEVNTPASESAPGVDPA